MTRMHLGYQLLGVLVVVLLAQCPGVLARRRERKCSNDFLQSIRERHRARKYCLSDQRCWPDQREFQRLSEDNPTLQVILPGEPGWEVASNLTLNVRTGKTPGAVIYVTSVSDVQAVINFAVDFNLDLKIVSSGHEYMGRNTGEGALLMSVVRMKSISTDLDCEANPGGGCMTVQPGVIWTEAHQRADSVGRVIMSSICLTVSVSGWVFGGGHSVLSPEKGLGVDQLLEVTMVLSDRSIVVLNDHGTTRRYLDGRVVTTDDKELFFAVRGGGGGTFGVVTSLTYKLHKPPSKLSKFACLFADPNAGAPDGDGGENMYKVLKKEFLPAIERLPKEFGGFLNSFIACWPNAAPNTGCTFVAAQIVELSHWGPRSGKNKIYFDQLEALGARFSEFFMPQLRQIPGAQLDQPCSILEFTSGGDMVRTAYAPPGGHFYVRHVGTFLQEGQLTFDHLDTEAEILANSYRQRRNMRSIYHRIGGTKGQAAANIAVKASITPDFRTASFLLQTRFESPEERESVRCEYEKSLNRMVKKPSKYYSEARDDLKPNVWKKAFWGKRNYLKLRKIKTKYDRVNLFNCRQCVGSRH